jgi:ubiquinone/menaquinone biosynthesis C-methylase UbiE
MASPAGIAGVFDRAADTYDNVGVEWFRPIAAGLVEELKPQPGERALDIGCGRGAALRPLAEAVGPTGYALGVDLAPAMVTRTAADLHELPQVEVRVADARTPGLPLSSFDVVASSLVLFFLSDPDAAVREWARLLRPGGRLGVATFGPQDERWRRVDAVFTPYLPPALLDARTSGTRGPFASDAGVAELLRGAGLVDVRTASSTIAVAFRDADQLLEFSWSHGQRAMWEAVPEAERDAVRQRITDVVGEWADDTGGFTFSQHVRYTLARSGSPLSAHGS